MNKILRAANWVALAFFGFAVLLIAVGRPSASILSALNLIPFGLALVAARGDARRSAKWAGLTANGLWTLLYLGLAITVLAGFGGDLIAVPLLLLIAAPCFLNVTSIWGLLQADA